MAWVEGDLKWAGGHVTARGMYPSGLILQEVPLPDSLWWSLAFVRFPINVWGGAGRGGPSRTCASSSRGLQLSDPQCPGGNFLGIVLQFKTHPAHPSFLPPLLSHFQTHTNFSSNSLFPNKYLASLICPSVCFPEGTKLTEQSGQREVWTEMVGLGSRSCPPAPSVRLLCPQWLWVPQGLGGTLCRCALGGSKQSHTCPSSIPLPDRQAELGGRAIYPGDRHRRSTGRYPGGQMMSGAAAHLTQVGLWVRLQMGGWGY